MTTKINFEEVVRAVNDNAFTWSYFPLILSLEMHCCPEQIGKIAKILNKVFGNQLLTHQDGHKDMPLVSPEGAKNKVLVKAKLRSLGKHAEHAEEGKQAEESDDEESDSEGERERCSSQ